MTFHLKLQELRKQRGLTQEELAQMLYVSRSAVSKWESGRGCPNLDSLAAIARLFSVSVEDLLSGEALLTVSQNERKERDVRTRSLVFGLLDCGAALLLFLPLFGQTTDGTAQSLPLPALTSVSPMMRVLFLVAVSLLVLCGVATLALQNCRAVLWVRAKDALSLALGTLASLLFILARQPYAAVFAFVLLLIKAVVMWRRS